jgi:ATP-dependent helicase/nuclease subunit A
MGKSRRTSADDTSRRRIVEDLDTTFLVEAGAGSGKTTKLVDRISALLALGKAEVGRIAAVTFTRKAAAELRERLQQRLEESAARAPDPAVRDRMRTAVTDIGHAFIGTIHSFCARILRERPVESGLDPDFTELHEAEGSRFLEICWQDFLADAHLRNDPVLKRLGEIGIDAQELEELYQRLCQFRDVEPHVPVCAKPDLKPARSELRRFMTEVGKAVPSAEPEGGWDKLQSAYRRARWLLDTYGDGRDKDLIDILELFEKCPVTLNRWPDKKMAKAFKDEVLPDFVRDTVLPTIKGWREHVYSDCVAFALAAAEFAAARRASDSTLDYTDLLIKARDLLRDSDDVRGFFARRFTHILVDEFQDTDPIQCEMIFYLCGDLPNRRATWRQFKLRPGALFVVGDPKQSIYRFRRADIAAYNVVGTLIQQSCGEVLTLSANYRSVNSIGEFVDGAFEDVFPAEATEQQAAFVPLATQRKDVAPFSGVRKLVVAGVSKKGEIFEHSSALVASWLAWALAGHVQVDDGGGLRPAAPGDILILTWQRESLTDIARALEARQVPFDITGTRGAFEVPEIHDTLKLLGSLADPDNPVALVGVLISPLFGHSYQALWDYKKAGGLFRFLGATHLDDPLAAHPVAVSLARIESWWRLTLDRSPAAAIGSILEQTGLVPLAAASPLGATMAGRLLQLVEMARRAEEFGKADFPSAVEWLSSAIEADVEPLSVLLGRADLVRVMNLHRAKGLEAPIVILAAPYKAGPRSPECHVDRFGEKEPSAWFQVTRKIGEYASKIVAQPPGWEQKQVVERQYQAAEESRLRYVAATRARQLLIISDAPQISRGTNPWTELLSDSVVELPMDGIDTPVQERPQVKVKSSTCARDLKGVIEAMEAMACPGYEQASVTEIAKPPGGLPTGKSGRGPEYGSIVHRCLEWMANDREPTRRDIELLGVQFELDPAPADEILAELQRVKQSDLWHRAMSAPERHSEVPFSLMLDGTELGREPGQVLLSGIIDLAFREGDRWHLVDYKTDRIVGDANTFVTFYAGQLRLYEKAWHQLSGRAGSELFLFFTDSCTAHQIV